ncbi:POMGNT1 [Symbiodinium sp. CCMP2592]|nr:POMGNT1 [Symbiodinium sp. CCMP2592]
MVITAAPLKPAVRERAEATAEAAGWKPGLRRMAVHAKGLQSFGTVAAAAKAHSIHVPMLLVAAGHSVAALNALQVAFAIAALLSGALLVSALSRDVWSKVLTSQEVDRHSLHAHFNLAEGCMRVRFYPDRAQPWKQVPEPLRVPWVPLAQLAEGPPGLAEFRRQLVRPGQRVDALGALPGERDLEFVVKNLDKSARSRDWDPTYFHELDAVSALVHLCCCAALLLSFLALMAELIGASLHRRQLPAKRVGSVRVLRLAGALSMASAAAVAFALTQYSAVCRYRLKVLVSEFLLGITAGDVVVWPQDLTMVWGGGVYFALASGLLSFLSGVCLVFAELDSTTAETTSAAVGKVQTEVRRVEDRHFTSRGSAASIASEIETLEQEALEYVPEAVTTTEQQKEEELQFLTILGLHQLHALNLKSLTSHSVPDLRRALEATEAQLKAHNRLSDASGSQFQLVAFV